MAAPVSLADTAVYLGVAAVQDSLAWVAPPGTVPEPEVHMLVEVYLDPYFVFILGLSR